MRPFYKKLDEVTHQFAASEFNHTLCKFCACTKGKPWHKPDPRRMQPLIRVRPGLPLNPCQSCGALTLVRCMACEQPTCPTCQFSMAAMCQACRATYVGPVWKLGQRADAYIRAECERLFAA